MEVEKIDKDAYAYATRRIYAIKFSAKHLNGKTMADRIQAEGIVRRLEKELKEDVNPPIILNKNFSPLNFKDYLERLKSKKDLESIPQELQGPFYSVRSLPLLV